MRSLTIEARSLESAQALCSALQEFAPELSGSEEDGYRVSVELGSFDRQVLVVLDVIEQHVIERSSPARVELDGRSYTVHPR
jgi:hypothetical protein